MSRRHGFTEEFQFCKHIATAAGNTTLVATPGASRALCIQELLVTVTTAAAQAFDVEDTSGTVELFKAPASLAVNTYGVTGGPNGIQLTSNEALVFTASAGVGLTISGYGWIKDNA